MSEIITPRRGFITGLAALVAAPAIVRAESLMHLRSTPIVPPLGPDECEFVIRLPGGTAETYRMRRTNLGWDGGRITINFSMPAGSTSPGLFEGLYDD